MTYALARDHGLPLSRPLSTIHPTLHIPLNALLLTTLLVLAFGLLSLASTSTLSAIAAASVVALGLSYALPPLIHCCRGRGLLPEGRAFRLNRVLGWVCNLVGIGYTAVTTVLFLFPPVRDVTAGSMNYCLLVFAVVAVGCAAQWWWGGGRRDFGGPRVGEGVRPHDGGGGGGVGGRADNGQRKGQGSLVGRDAAGARAAEGETETDRSDDSDDVKMGKAGGL